jgi:hypothetical protein
MLKIAPANLKHQKSLFFMPSAQNKLVRLVNKSNIFEYTSTWQKASAFIYLKKNFSFKLNKQAYKRDICLHIVSEEQC